MTFLASLSIGPKFYINAYGMGPIAVYLVQSQRRWGGGGGGQVANLNTMCTIRDLRTYQ